jgi:hypothetical protein
MEESKGWITVILVNVTELPAVKGGKGHGHFDSEGKEETNEERQLVVMVQNTAKAEQSADQSI